MKSLRYEKKLATLSWRWGKQRVHPLSRAAHHRPCDRQGKCFEGAWRACLPVFSCLMPTANPPSGLYI